MGGSSPLCPGAVPIPGSQPLCVQIPSRPRLSIQLPPNAPSFDKHCAPAQAPQLGRGDHDRLSYDQLHDLCERAGYSRGGPTAALKTGLASMGVADRKRTLAEDDAMDASEALTRKRGRAPDVIADNSDALLGDEGKRCRACDLHWAFVVDRAVAKERAK